MKGDSTSTVFQHNCPNYHDCCQVPHPQRLAKICSYCEQPWKSWILLPRKPSSLEVSRINGDLCCWICLSDGPPPRSMNEPCDFWRSLLGSGLYNLKSKEDSESLPLFMFSWPLWISLRRLSCSKLPVGHDIVWHWTGINLILKNDIGSY